MGTMSNISLRKMSWYRGNLLDVRVLLRSCMSVESVQSKTSFKHPKEVYIIQPYYNKKTMEIIISNIFLSKHGTKEQKGNSVCPCFHKQK